MFSDQHASRDIRKVLEHIKAANATRNSLTGSHLMVVGMPNVGKSSLLNALRRQGVGKGKAAKTGDQPGVTRTIARSGVKIHDAVEEGTEGGNVYLMDTPGVFMPYVPDAINRADPNLLKPANTSGLYYGGKSSSLRIG